MQKHFLATCAAAAVLSSLLQACGGGGGGGPSDTGSNISAWSLACTGQQGRVLGTATVLTSVVVDANGGVPGYCKLNARIDNRLNFELRVPVSWNQKLHYSGGGGYDGSIPPLGGTSLNALLKGYASVASDSGHQAGSLDASWALNDATAAQLFGYLSVPTVTAAATELLRTAFGVAPVRSYFEGCSGGGREGLMMAQRYPTLFDGVIARAPAYNWTGAMGAYNRNAKSVAVAEGQFGSAKVALLAAAVRNACDAADGIVDGVVSNPAACTFNPQTLRCPGGGDTGSGCLSDAQLGVVNAWTSTATFAAGAYGNAGWPLTGNEDDAGGWAEWVTGSAGGNGNVRVAAQYLLQDTTIKAYLAKNLGLDSLTYTPYDQNTAALGTLASLNDATNADLRPFSARNAKLLLWHGGSDAALSVNATTAYYQAVVGAVGGQAAADGFVRYYVAPGVNHCSGGAGADDVDLLAALDAWISGNTAPGTLGAGKAVNGSTAFTRPLCVYPRYPRYVGPASDAVAAKQAINYSCTLP